MHISALGRPTVILQILKNYPVTNSRLLGYVGYFVCLYFIRNFTSKDQNKLKDTPNDDIKDFAKQYIYFQVKVNGIK